MVQNTSSGNTVDNPFGLSAADGQVATLNSTGSNGPYMVVDLGRLAGGRVEIGVTADTGTPIRLAYSEARRFDGPEGRWHNGRIVSNFYSDHPSPRSPKRDTNGSYRDSQRDPFRPNRDTRRLA